MRHVARRSTHFLISRLTSSSCPPYIKARIFAPQALRDAANDLCQSDGRPDDIYSFARNGCENGTSLFDSVKYSVDQTGFLNSHLLPMLTGSKTVGDANALVDKVRHALDFVF